MIDNLKKANVILSEKIRAAISASPKSAREIAAEVGVSPQAIVGWKKTGAISKDSLALLAKAVGMHLYDFIDVSEPSPTYDADTQEVINLMLASDSEGKILAKNAVIEALEKYEARQNRSKLKLGSQPGSAESLTDYEKILGEIAKIDAITKLDDLTTKVKSKSSELKRPRS